MLEPRFLKIVETMEFLMTKKMLIDASLPDETRLVIAQGQRIEVFETETNRQIKNNIYLAQISRVESSLQAAFVEYGGNRHGFLAFSEIHPDYFQIPVDDRPEDRPEDSTEPQPQETAALEPPASQSPYSTDDLLAPEEDEFSYKLPDSEYDDSSDQDIADQPTANQQRRPARPHQKYNIQEVIKRGQVLLVQVVKEERGNKGAALTTFLSLAGRYCVLMPNTDRSGGVSRSISNNKARSKLRDLATSLEIPEGMSLILRTAGAQQAQSEIERDFEYLTRLWDNIRSLTLSSVAPALIYEEGNLIHRALRDMIKKDISEIRIEGEQGYQQAKSFLQMLISSDGDELLAEHKEAEPIFSHYGIENALDDMNTPTVQLKSGGYIVINQTEALVAVDVNSGRSTREHNIEDTALKTNLEAADEICRQARLRDLAGLIVIDFIDMENSRNVNEVEKRMRDATRHDRARIQLGRISQNFGLFEMSRQRLRPELSAGRSEMCPQCHGTGQTLTAQTIALRALRAARARAAQAGAHSETTLQLEWPVVLYILNNKRDEISLFEREHNLKLKIEASGIDNPDAPWDIKTKKSTIIPQQLNGRSHEAVSVETAYAQMPDASAFERQGDDQNASQNESQNSRQNARKNKSQNSRQHENQNTGQEKRRGRNRGRGNARGKPRAEGQKNRPQDKKQQNQPKTPQQSKGKASLWQRLTGRND